MESTTRKSASTARSPSSRRAWIEISAKPNLRLVDRVALLTEGVDRNYQQAQLVNGVQRRPPHGGRG